MHARRHAAGDGHGGRASAARDEDKFRSPYDAPASSTARMMPYEDFSSLGVTLPPGMQGSVASAAAYQAALQQGFYWGVASAAQMQPMGYDGYSSALSELGRPSGLGVSEWGIADQDSVRRGVSWAAGVGPLEDTAGTKTAKRRGSRKGKKAAAAAAMAASSTVSYADLLDSVDISENDDEPIDPNCPYRARWGEAYALCDSEQYSTEALELISENNAAQQHDLLMWMLRYIKVLALSKQGTHVVQKLLEHVNKADKERITTALKPHIQELYESAHGNHVLAKIVEQLPSATVQFIVRDFLSRGREVARHQYGCRIMERLIEHSPDEGDMMRLLDEIVRDAESLCRHPFGNFVVQHLLEHGSNERRQAILDQVAERIPALSMHRTASHFVQQLLDYVEPELQRVIVRKLLQAETPESMLEVAGSRYGSFVVEQVASVESMYEEVRDTLAALLPYFTVAQLKFARRVIDKFDLKLALQNVSDVGL
mmetsp:Transcript_33034/g.77233  ORF Transcript_33034/g.77233 Transcript_33034/m.77233 type:complete len:484 (-) Transcript_33034:116-1567(-)|eukprot:CAMPEP_0178392866 /NCGR_PEP_ID=MMETSP0689_2-20121128/11897_1 /TAXON_ID=160604 /ORGANISM="Amphidinium massartii, Strain CS-259" /LENGTH=483 /DNA_ID=CAMNT_0020013449 /DNA_START=271 /DNA_END=1722 /DNA_ORIENTATION=+